MYQANWDTSKWNGSCVTIDELVTKITQNEIKCCSISFTYSLPNADWKRLSVAMATNTSVQSVYVGCAEIDKVKAQFLTEIIKNKNDIDSLRVGTSKIDAQSWKMICEAIKVLKCVKKIGVALEPYDQPGSFSQSLGSALRELRSNFGLVIESHNNKKVNRFLRDQGCLDLAKSLGGQNAIEELELCEHQITDAGCLGLSQIIQGTCVLKSLKLQWNQIGDSGCAELCRPLEGQQEFEQLDLSNNRLASKALSSLGQVVKSCPKLSKLILDSNQLAAYGALSLSSALEVTRSLTVLNLGCNKLGDAGLSALCKGLASNKSVHFLDVSRNEIGILGATAFGEMLKLNTALYKLDLSYNWSMGDEGSAAICGALSTNQSLSILDLMAVDAGDLGAKALSEALKVNKRIYSLDLRDNKLTKSGLQLLEEGLRRNHSITAFSCVEIGGEEQEFAETVQQPLGERNRDLKSEAFLAAQEGNVEALRFFLDQGVALDGWAAWALSSPSDPVLSLSNVTLLELAADYGHIEIVRELLQRGARAFVGTPREYAVKNGHQEVVDLFDSL